MLLAGTTLAASFGGYLLAGLNEARRDRRSANQARQSRAEDARLRRDEARHELQLDALKALQEDVQLLVRQCGRALHFDHMQARKGQFTLLPETWSEEELTTRMSLQRNVSRVLDEDVRLAVEELSDVTARLGMSPAGLMGLTGDDLEAAADARMHPLMPLAERVNAVIGVALRRELDWEPSNSRLSQASLS